MSLIARDFPPRSGTAGEAPPAQAERWLQQWQTIGGGVTITRERQVSPWRFVPSDLPPGTRKISDELEADLLRELDERPGLAAAVRAITASTAISRFARALKTLRPAP